MDSSVWVVLASSALGLFGRRPARQGSLDEAWQEVLDAMKPPYDLQATLFAALTGLGKLIEAPGYYAYAADAAEGPLLLKATRTATGTPTVGPNYAGLVGGGPIRQAPLDLPIPADPTQLIVDGTKVEPYVSLSCGEQVLLRIAVPARFRLEESARQALLTYAYRLRPLLAVVLYADRLGRRAEENRIEATTQQRALELVLQVDEVLRLVCRLGGEALAATGGYFASWQEGAVETEMLWQGDDQALVEAIDPRQLAAALPVAQAAVWSAPRLPAPVLQLGYKGFVVVPVVAGREHGALVYASKSAIAANDHLRSVLSVLGQSLASTFQGRALSAATTASYVEALYAIVDMLDAADPFNQAHSQQVAKVAVSLGRSLGMTSQELSQIEMAGRLHDLGMVAVSLDLPMTKGTLSETSRALIQRHPEIGYDLLASLPEGVASRSVRDAVRYHHERWDGLGYPEGLAGEDIPLSGRLLATAENYVARTSARSYRAGLPPERALFEVDKLRATQLDPAMVDLLLSTMALQGIEPRQPEI